MLQDQPLCGGWIVVCRGARDDAATRQPDGSRSVRKKRVISTLCSFVHASATIVLREGHKDGISLRQSALRGAPSHIKEVG